jgi:hypothetical protein
MRARTPALIAIAVSLATLACSLLSPLLPGSSDTASVLVTAGAPAITLPPADSSPTGPPEPLSTGVPESLPLSPEVEAQMIEIEQQVVALRGLSPRTDSQRTLLNAEQLRQRVIDDFLADYTPQEAADDAQVLGLLGLLDPEFDLHNFYIELYSEQVAGYYDDEVQRMFVVADRGFQGPERLTHAHEYVHALQDQTYDFQEGLKYTDEACEEDSERCAGIQALVEGDASLLEEQWARTYATQQDIEEIIAFYEDYESPIFDRAPDFMKDDFLYPYLQGAEFVRTLYLSGGWAGVDAAYQNLPLSTEQILHPERYPDDTPRRVSLDDLSASLGPGWREIDLNNLGEWYSYLTLRELIPDDQAAAAAEGWGGDTYRAYFNDETRQTALVQISSWDRLSDAEEFYLALRSYGDSRLGEHSGDTLTSRWEGPRESMLAERNSDQVLWILAPDPATLDALRQAVVFTARVE